MTRPLDARGWREFWRERGERELAALLRDEWGALGAAPLDAYREHATRVATLLGSRARERAVASELGRMREALDLVPDPQRDARAAAAISTWFQHVDRMR